MSPFILAVLRPPSPWRRRSAAAGLLLGVLVLAGCGTSGQTGDSKSQAPAKSSQTQASRPEGKPKYTITEADTAGLSQAIFAGGCFWCLETAFEGVEGIQAAISGYAGGDENDPSYEEVGGGATGHAESVLVTYDPEVISYEDLLHIFWVNHDPFYDDRQFCDRGRQYRPAIFPLSEVQERDAKASIEWAESHLQKNGHVVTEITRVDEFWPAEIYHQDFYKKDPRRYQSYREGCGRDRRLLELWGDHATVH